MHSFNNVRSERREKNEKNEKNERKEVNNEANYKILLEKKNRVEHPRFKRILNKTVDQYWLDTPRRH